MIWLFQVPEYGPPLPNPCYFQNIDDLRHFLVVKLLNGEKAALSSPGIFYRLSVYYIIICYIILYLYGYITAIIVTAQRYYYAVFIIYF